MDLCKKKQLNSNYQFVRVLFLKFMKIDFYGQVVISKLYFLTALMLDMIYLHKNYSKTNLSNVVILV
jgi:hypothetical protein